MLTSKANNPLIAISYLLKGIKLLTNERLRSFLLMPILINLGLYSAALILGYFYLNELIQRFIPDWLHWLDWLLWPMFFVGFFIAGFFTFTLMANILAAPFYGRLAAKTLSVIGANIDNQAIEQPLLKVLLAEFKRLIYLAKLALPLLLLFWIPGLNLIAPVLWVLFGAWGIALEYLAYPLENSGMLFSEQKNLVKQMSVGALSFGGLTMLGLSLPILNIVIAPAAVIGATIYIDEITQSPVR